MEKQTISQHIDRLFQALGVWGTYQILQLVIVESLCLPASFELFAVLYTGYQPPVRCKGLENVTLIDNTTDYQEFYKNCNDVVDVVNGSRVTGSCSRGYEYNQPKFTTFVTEWDLVCGQSYQAQLPQTLLIGGQLAGASFFTSMADRFGRRKICLLSQVGILVMSVASAFSPSLTVLAVLRFFTGTFQQGLVMSISVISLEVLPTEYRSVACLCLGVLWPICLQVLNGLGYVFRYHSWRHLQLVLGGVVFVTFLPNLIFLKETLRWLFANGRTDDAKKIVSKAIRLNKAEETEVSEQTRYCVVESTRLRNRGEKGAGTVTELSTIGTFQRNEEIEKPLSLIDIFKIPRLRFTACVMFYVWIVSALTYFGLVLTSAKLAGNRFLNYFLVSIDMLPSTFIAYYMINRIGRKVTCVTFHTIAGVSLIVAALVQAFGGSDLSTLVTVLTVLGKFGISAAFTLLFLYTPELYPTNLRSFGLGFASSASRLGGMLAPFSNLVVDYVPWAPGTAYGTCCLIACLLLMRLPETRNKELPQTIAEINSWKDYSARSEKNKDQSDAA